MIKKVIIGVMTTFFIFTCFVPCISGNITRNINVNKYEPVNVMGNGIPDLVVVNDLDNDVSVLLNDGFGRFGNRHDYVAGTHGLGRLGVGDFNMDNNIDLAITFFYADCFSVLLGDDNGSFSLPQYYDTGNSWDSCPTGVVSGNFNEDFYVDLAVANAGDDSVSILLGDGSGEFGSFQDFPTVNDPRQIIAVDFNEDEHLDLAITHWWDSKVSILFGDGNGSFDPFQAYVTGSEPHDLVSGDFNEDDNIDLAVANWDSNNVNIFIGDGQGGFIERLDYPLGDDRCGPNRIITADFNKDDNLDLAVTNFRYGYIGVIYGDGEGGFGSFQNYPTGDGANSVASADFNMDGNLDLAVTSHYENFVSILHGNGAGDFPERYDYPIGEWATEIAVVDFNTSPLIETELEIEIIGGFGTHMVIRNIGDECAYNIDWNAEISGGILGRINKSDDGYIGMLPADSEIVVDLPFIIGLGLLDMTVTGSASNVETASWTKKGIIFLFFVII